MLDLLGLAIPLLSILIAVIASIFLVIGIDDIVLDIVSLIYWNSRRSKRHSDLPPFTLKTLLEMPEKPVALMVPTWQEAPVIDKMLLRAIEVLQYNNYRIYVGVYPNDLETMAVVKSVADVYSDRVTMVVLDHPGPTTKSDNVNSIITYIFADEQRLGQPYEIFVIDDAEDYLPPHELNVFNYFIPFRDIVQLPVFPMDAGWGEFTSGHYMDEFSQMHLKDMPVREWLTGIIPSAGVGTGFSRRAMFTAMRLNNGRVFSEETLTEDYELPMLLASSVERSVFAGLSIEPEDDGSLFSSGAWSGSRVAVRSFFPRHFWTAVRQKTRWVIGITLQGWDHLGWEGSPYQRYMLARDRKALIGNIVTFLGYILVVMTLLVWYSQRLLTGDQEFPQLVNEGSWVWFVLIANFYVVIYRLIVRAICTYKIYGLVHAFLSAPRAVWGNLINFCATVRAIWIYLTHSRQDRARIPWDKTEHEFLE